MAECRWIFRLGVFAALAVCAQSTAPAQVHVPLSHQLVPVVREEHKLSVRPLLSLPAYPVPDEIPPPTVAGDPLRRQDLPLSLDGAIRIALENSQIVRVVSGASVVAIGSTYDPAIAATQIDAARSVFDPVLDASNIWSQFEQPQAFFDLTRPELASIGAFKIQDYALRAGVSKTNILGGVSGVRMSLNNDLFGGAGLLNPSDPFTFNPLDPRTSTALEFTYRQPLLQGAGLGPNLAPIKLAQIGTEASFYQLKGNLQDMVRSTIEAYWGLLLARIDVWVRRKQVEESKFSFEQTDARLKRGLASSAEVAQTRLAYANFRATLIGAEGEVFFREAVLRNLMGIPPADPLQLVPVTPLATEQVVLDWQALVATAQAQRPDLGQLKLAIQAAQQRLVLAKNTALPRVDFVSVYRFNQLWGTSPTGADIDTTGDQFTDWSLGVNTTAPLGLRQARAELRRQELTLARDRANLQQGTHNAVHQLATSYRRLVQYYEQYLAFRDTREAAELNLQQQMAEYQRGRAIFLEVLQAITAWGDAVRAEARTLAEYNLEKANLERETGMILEFHGVELLGQNYHSRGPLAPLNDGRGYPHNVHPNPNQPRYPAGSQPAEKGFESPILPSSAPRR